MRYDRVEFLNPNLYLMDIDKGTRFKVTVGTIKDLEKVHYIDREYHVVKGTRIGVVTNYWDTMAAAGLIRLVKIPDGADPTWYGIPLPITASNQLTPNLHEEVLAYFIRGRLVCLKCSLLESQTYPERIEILPKHIFPYSQDCHACGQLLVSMWKVKNNQPNILYKKYVKPEKKKR